SHVGAGVYALLEEASRAPVALDLFVAGIYCVSRSTSIAASVKPIHFARLIAPSSLSAGCSEGSGGPWMKPARIGRWCVLIWCRAVYMAKLQRYSPAESEGTTQKPRLARRPTMRATGRVEL